ncbi:MAG TPA: AEC family transporter [Aquifex aeolicus]|uniref:AEC family transporter n=1 Tax=Aquifex aeolicus TaxID=63363 RepID=A0A9D0YPC4_AQUAO|nr:AEC family transporter [Aquificales bacterium]HIP86150.1 AEC family transporter [Aquifex sp.]HIP98053.1 AEC family transporter [Aquifex aeolicus]HIQ26729.1 AEC family transporter [Aquifex aeolicus]
MAETLLVFYLLVASGYLLKILRVFSTEEVETFVHYIIYFALPVAVFGVIHDFEFSLKDITVFGTAWFTIALTYFAVFKVLAKTFKDERELKTLFLTSAFGNTAFVGYPIAYTLFGDKGLAYAILYDVVGNFFVVVTFAIFTITGRADWRTVYRFPPLGALILALLLKPFPITLLKPFIVAVKSSITPVIVFSLGLKIDPKGVLLNLKPALLSVFWRQMAIPAVVLLWLYLLNKYILLPFEERMVILLQSSMPPFVMSVILSEKYRLKTDLAVTAVNLGLAVLVLSLPFWFTIGKVVLKGGN